MIQTDCQYFCGDISDVNVKNSEDGNLIIVLSCHPTKLSIQVSKTDACILLEKLKSKLG